MRTLASLAAASIALTLTAPASAAVVGDVVSCDVLGTGIFSCDQPTAVVERFPREFVVGVFPGNPTNALIANFGVSSVLARTNADFDLNHLEIGVRGNLNLAATILSFRNLSALWNSYDIRTAQNITGWRDDRVSLTDGTLNIDLRGTQWRSGFRIDTASLFTIRLNQVPYPAGVPEPALWAMMIAGFGLMGSALRRKKSHLLAA